MSRVLFIKGVSIGYLKQILQLVIGVVSVPLMLNYFHETLYGVLTLILGLIGYLNTISFGIPQAMTTLVAKEADYNKKFLILKKSTKILSYITSLFLLIFFCSIYFFEDWFMSILGNIPNAYIDASRYIFILFVITTLIKLPLNIYINFFSSLNLVYISEYYNIAILVINFLALLATLYFKLDVYWYISLFLLSQLIINIFAMIHILVLYLKNKYILKFADKHTYDKLDLEIIRSGMSFFKFGIAASLIWSTDNIIISNVLSPDDVTIYSIAFKMFLYIFTFTSIINATFAPLYGKLISENNFAKLQSLVTHSLNILQILGVLMWTFLIFFSKEIIMLWTGNINVFGGYDLYFYFGLYGYIVIFINTFVTLIMSLNLVSKIIWLVWFEATLNLFISIILIEYMGIAGVALGTVVAVLLPALMLPKILSNITANKFIVDFSYTRRHFFYIMIPTISISILSISIEVFEIKLFLFITIFVVNIFLSWRFLSFEDKNYILNILKRKV